MRQSPRLISLDQVDSTNDEVRRRRAAGEPAPFWVRAARQSAGRGRRGRAWVSEPGNLYASGLYELAAPTGEIAQLTFAAALAAAEVAQASAPGAAVRLKWPNDVLVEGRKAAGVLLESRSLARGAELVVGVGVNLQSAPDDVERPAVALADIAGAAPLSPEVAADWLVDSFERWRWIWAGDGFAEIRDAWLARATGLGDRVTARLAEHDIVGTFVDLDEDGALVLETAAGLRRVRAGEVFFGEKGAMS